MAEQPPPQKPEKKRSEYADLWRLLSLGVQLTVTVALFASLGWWLESKQGWPGWSRTVISLFGIGVGLYMFVKDATR